MELLGPIWNGAKFQACAFSSGGSIASYQDALRCPSYLQRSSCSFIRYWLIQRDTAQPFFSDRPTLDEASQSVRQTNATHVPPIRPFEAISDIAQYRIVVSIGQGRWRTIISERECCPPVGIMMSDQHGASVPLRRSASGANDVWAPD